MLVIEHIYRLKMAWWLYVTSVLKSLFMISGISCRIEQKIQVGGREFIQSYQPSKQGRNKQTEKR